jgi:DNA-binding NtrC family response regulator
MTPKALRVLLVDDDQNILKTLGLALKALHCQVTFASGVTPAIKELEHGTFDLILTDYRMGEQTGTDLIRAAKHSRPEALIAVMTAFASIDNAIEVTKEGAFDYLPKPFTQTQLAHLLKKVRLVTELKQENEALKSAESTKQWFTGLVSVASHRLDEFIRKTAPTEATILLVGESGTGKTQTAQIIHQRSARHKGPFVVVNCTSLTESLLESEIFGHVKGAFTGAVSDKTGKFELAQNGTVFLDEIGDLSLQSQSKLLRFLQEKVIERVGSNQTIPVDTRVIAATNRNLPELVAAGKFREDLYFRLNIFESALVPLRFRKEDLPVMIQKLLPSSAVLTDAVRERLLAYSWPGNIRELRNTIERLVILSEGGPLKVDDLPEAILNPKKAEKDYPLRTLEEVEREHIERVLAIETNLDRAAEILGITKVTLWRKRKEYGLP